MANYPICWESDAIGTVQKSPKKLAAFAGTASGSRTTLASVAK